MLSKAAQHSYSFLQGQRMGGLGMVQNAREVAAVSATITKLLADTAAWQEPRTYKHNHHLAD
jgi:hypothetical protein